MKKVVILLLSGLACISSLTGCSEPVDPAELTEKYGPEPISANMLAQDIYDTLQYEWDLFDSLSAEQKMISSHIPGICYKDFADWVTCEEFLDMSVPNPLEEATWLDNGTYVGMPEGFRDTPHVQASWYGTKEGHVEWLSVQSGYRDGDIRVTLDAMMYGDPAEGKSTDSGWSIELERQHDLTNLGDNSVPVTEGSGEGYVSRTAYLAQGYVLYRIDVIGEPDMQGNVQETLEKVLLDFNEA